MKKNLLKFLSVCVAGAMLVACSSTPKTETAKKEEPKTEKTQQADNTAKKYEIKKEVFVQPQYVNDLIDGKNSDVKKYVVAEVTWGEAKDSKDYLTKHIKGAIHINTDMVEEGPVWNMRKPAELEKNMTAYGIDKDTTVILYGPDTGTHRVALALLYMGVENVKVLDGGLAAYEKAGFKTDSGEVKPTAVASFGVSVPTHPEYVLSLDDVKEKLKDKKFKLISVRSKEEYLGQTSGYSYIPKAGEPKGAYFGESGIGNGGMENYQNDDGTNKKFEDIAANWSKNGFTPEDELSFYCGTGWRACLPFLLMYERGLNATLFDGGWNEWQMHDELEVQVGDPKSSDVVYTTVGKLENGKEAK